MSRRRLKLDSLFSPLLIPFISFYPIFFFYFLFKPFLSHYTSSLHHLSFFIYLSLFFFNSRSLKSISQRVDVRCLGKMFDTPWKRQTDNSPHMYIKERANFQDSHWHRQSALLTTKKIRIRAKNLSNIIYTLLKLFFDITLGKKIFFSSFTRSFIPFFLSIHLYSFVDCYRPCR